MRKKTLFGIIGAILLAAVFIFCGVGSSWFTNGDFKTWFNGWGYGNGEENKDQSNVIVTEGGSNGISLMTAEIAVEDYGVYGLSEETTETAYTLAISVVPENSVVEDFTWTVEFVNPASDWAADKDIAEYFTVTPAEDNRSAVAACKQAFGEQIKIKVVYDGDETIFATKMADYVQRVNESIVRGLSEFGSGEDTEFYIDYVYGVGTVKGTVSRYTETYWLELSDNAYEYITKTDTSAYPYYAKFVSDNNNSNLLKKETYHYPYDDDSNCITFTVTSFVSGGSVTSENYLSAAFRVLSENTINQYRGCISFTYTYGENYTEEVTIYTDWLNLQKDYFCVVSNVSILGGNLIY